MEKMSRFKNTSSANSLRLATWLTLISFHIECEVLVIFSSMFKNF